MNERDALVQEGCSKEVARMAEDRGTLFIKSTLKNENEGIVIAASDAFKILGATSFESAVLSKAPWLFRGNVKQGFMVTIIHGLEKELSPGQVVNPALLTMEAVENFKAEERERD